jgi:hypothetical protein
MKRVVSLLGVTAAFISTATVGVSLPAAGVAGTWTRITSPQGPLHSLFPSGSSSQTLQVAGTVSADVTGLDVYCFRNSGRSVNVTPLNTVSPITPTANHAFQATLAVAFLPACVLRAVPTSYTGLDGSGNNNGYVGAFAGPSLYTATRLRNTPQQGYLDVSQPQGYHLLWSADAQGVFFADPVDARTKTTAPIFVAGYTARLQSGQFVASGPSTRSGLRIDGHNVYLAGSLIGIADPSAIPTVGFTVTRSATGNATVAETEPLRRCPGDAYPPTNSNCATPLSVPVVMKRSMVTSANGAVLTIRDRFVSLNGAAHTVGIEYANSLGQLQFGDSGIRLPGQSSFHAAPTNVFRAGFARRPMTVLTTDDRFTADGGLDRKVAGLTWSGAPTIYFPGFRSFGLRYTRTIPAGGSARFTFVQEVGWDLATVQALAGPAQRALTSHLVISRPRSGHVTSDNTPTVKGRITNATNGYPKKLTVTIGTKSKTVNVSATGRFRATFTLANGKHTVRAQAHDPAGTLLVDSARFRVT